MKVVNTKIRDLKIIQPKIYRDNRGYFFESFNSNSYKNLIANSNFVQDDHSFSKNNVLRGIHFQIKKPQDQLLYLVEGKIFICFVDLRPNSITFKKQLSLVLNSITHKQIFQPAGVASGYYVLSKQSHLIYKVSEIYSSANEYGIMWNDNKLNIKWPTNKPILSKKDKNNLNFKDINFQKIKNLCKL